jgi:5,10-methenyltetrahydrofolate synthetase
MQNKPALRSSLMAARTAIVNDQRRRLDNNIAAKILAWWETHRFGSLGVYWPMRGEPDLHALYTRLHAQGAQLALPVVIAPQQPLQFVAWTPGEAVQQDRFGACIPSAQNERIQPEALLIPCLGFTRSGYRLGYGGGFYDRTLAVKPRPYSLGIGYTNGETEFAPDTYDIVLDRIITDTLDFTCQ